MGTVESWMSYQIPKGIVQNVLEDLTKSGDLRVKEGKNKVYWFNQVQTIIWFVPDSLSCPLSEQLVNSFCVQYLCEWLVLQERFRSKGLDLTKLNKEVEEKKEALEAISEEHAAHLKQLRAYEATPPDGDLDRLIEELTEK